MLGFLKKIFGTAQSRTLRRYVKIVQDVNTWEIQFQGLSDDELRAKTAELRQRLQGGATTEDILPEAYAVVKNACRRLCGTQIHVSGYDQLWDMVPYDVQILGAIAMHYGAIAEMQTGEGKTLTASMPLYLNALTGKPVHLVTVNDYLAQRDCQWIGTIFRWLGMTVAALTHATPHHVRKVVYRSDILYGTASEFGFDYLRDNSMAQSKDEQAQRGHYFAIIDEVDSILIDEARTPLIISGPASASRQMYDSLKDHVAHVVRLQRDLCNKLATDARRVFEGLGVLADEDHVPKLGKDEQESYTDALKKMWLVGRGTPHNKMLKRVREHPEIRAGIEKWETYYYSDSNKQDKIQVLSELCIVVDERANEYELTDKGISAWSESYHGAQDVDAFTMFDLGYEYAQIDAHLDWSEEEKIQKKVQLREEDAIRKERAHNLRQLFRAHLLMEKDVDYIVSEGKIVIIDENTGRPQPGRRFADGLHQAIEAKEGLVVQAETQTYATITLQNYFRMYDKLAGMTGTAMTEANEFQAIYKMEVLAIPTHRPCQRVDADDEVYMTEREKYTAILKEVQDKHAMGRPILIGTESVEASQKLSRVLKQNQLPHTVLNAKNHVQEAAIIAGAGKLGAITVATNMAGRGTDIKLEARASQCGGLHVIGTTRHHSRRIDRQLRGRSARLGDPGSSIFYVSFEDSLMRMFSAPRITSLLQRFRPPEGEPISAKVLNTSIETAQKRIEQRNYNMRKHTLEYDDVMNKQRVEMYAFRNEVLHTEDILSLACAVIESACRHAAATYFVDREKDGGWNLEGYRNWLSTHFPITLDTALLDHSHLSRDEIADMTIEIVQQMLQRKIAHQRETIQHMRAMVGAKGPSTVPGGEEISHTMMRNILIHSIDRAWQEHLLQIDHLRTEVHLRAIGQKDPLTEFKHEAFRLFDTLTRRLHTELGHVLFKFEVMWPGVEIEPREVENGSPCARQLV